MSVTDDFEAKLIAVVSTQHVSDMQARLANKSTAFNAPRDLSRIYTLVACVSQKLREYKKLQL